MSKTCQVWYQIKGFDKYNLIKPDLKAFVVIWVKGQGQSRSGPKNKVKIQNCPTCQVWYQIKGFDKYNANKQDKICNIL